MTKASLMYNYLMDLSLIIVNWNTKEITLNCLRSVYESLKSAPAGSRNKLETTEVEILLVDNGSTDGSIEAIKSLFPQVKIIENSQNLGFAKANNQGMEIASGRYVLLLNSDTIVLDKALPKMVTWMDSHPDVGVTGCQLLNDDKTIQPTGGYFPTLGRVFAWMFFVDDLPILRNIIGPYHFRNQNISIDQTAIFSMDHEQDWVTGAFMMVRKEVIDKIGKLDDKYFMYFEEIEWCYRIKKAGWKITFTPAAKVIHLGQKSSSTSSVGSPTGLIGEYRGVKEFYKKYFPTWLPFVRLFLKLGALLRIILWGIIRGRKDAVKIYEEAFRLA